MTGTPNEKLPPLAAWTRYYYHSMDSSTGGAYVRTTISGGTMDGRRSFETAPSAARLHKQRSNHGLRSASHGQPFALSSAPQGPASRSSGPVSGGFGDGAKARKGSIRNAVRKIFGRRSRDSISQVTDAPASVTQGPSTRHTYHKSEPPALPSQPELPEPQVEDTHMQRVMSDSYQAQSHHRSTSLSRTGSPYAVQFPNSVRLKPMDLGNPFMAGPHQLRRRKTLPSMLIEKEEGAAAIAGSSDEPANASSPLNVDSTREAPEIPKRTPSSTKKARRKSRSVDDLPAAIAMQQGTPRKRSEEIRYWRESFQPDVLRASGFIARPSSSRDGAQAGPPSSSRRSNREGSVQEQGPEKTPMPLGRGTYDTSVSRQGALKSSPPGPFGQALSVHESEYRPSSGVGTEMSRDLEDRVAKLEAGLHTFQRSLQKLTADRNRRTIVMGSSIATRRSSGDLRTPSLLADTLADALDPASYSYEYEYGHTLRPSTSPQPPPPIPPQVQGREDPFGHDLPPLPPSERPARPSRRPSSPAQVTAEVMAAVGPEERSSKEQTPQPYTFRSLYQMLADERSARRKLESQLQGLRRDISELHSQVNLSSNIQSTRSSYMLAGSSSRLQDLLRETGEASGPEESPRSLTLARLSGASASQPAVSRFSGSESDNVQLEETDYEEYLTPREERSKYSLAEKLEKESEMF